jgi:hypothetical protein
MAESKLPRIGYFFCVLGLGVAMLSLLPGIVPPGDFPWPIFVGSAIYFPGAFLAFFLTKGKDRNKIFNQLRFIRLGFIAIMAILMIIIFRS